MELTGCGRISIPMRATIDNQRAHPANPFTAVMVESNRVITLNHKLMIKNVQHLKKGHVRVNAIEIVHHHLARRIGAFLAPDV